jgi:hypothetical protein
LLSLRAIAKLRTVEHALLRAPPVARRSVGQEQALPGVGEKALIASRGPSPTSAAGRARCWRRSCAATGKRLIPDDPQDAVPVLLSDLNMLLLSGGQERSKAEYGTLLAAAGFRPGRIQPVARPYGLIEGSAA